ncbi:MAG: restriction endonuclease [Bryobacteraceae bacterium]
MPERSNPFQRLVFVLKRELETMAKVKESAMLPDPTTRNKREVDVLIEQNRSGIPFRIGVECRDHSKVQDVIWIESVVTKQRDLGLDASIVVSSKGFTKGAKLKAKAHGIRTVSLKKGSETDWANTLLGELETLYWGEVTSTIQSVVVITDSGARGAVDPATCALDDQGRSIQLTSLISAAVTQAGMLKRVTPGKTGGATLDINPENLFLEDPLGSVDRIAQLTVQLKWAAPVRTPIPLRKGRLEQSPVAFVKGIASGEVSAIAKEVEVFIVRNGDEPVAIAKVLDFQGQTQEIRLRPEAPGESDTSDKNK